MLSWTQKAPEAEGDSCEGAAGLEESEGEPKSQRWIKHNVSWAKAVWVAAGGRSRSTCCFRWSRQELIFSGCSWSSRSINEQKIANELQRGEEQWCCRLFLHFFFLRSTSFTHLQAHGDATWCRSASASTRFRCSSWCKPLRIYFFTSKIRNQLKLANCNLTKRNQVTKSIKHMLMLKPIKGQWKMANHQ